MFTHPRKLNKLRHSDLRSLAQVLCINNTKLGDANINELIRRMISLLPQDLHDSFFSRLPTLIGVGAITCPTHKGLNRHLIENALDLIKREIALQNDVLHEFSGLLEQEVKTILRSLRAIQGIWTRPSSTLGAEIAGAWAFQINKCKACILSRICADRDALQNLRTSLLSRSREKHPPPKLLRFMEECISQHGGFKSDMFYNSGENAHAFKAARNAARKAKAQPKSSARRQGKGHDSEIDPSGDPSEDNYRIGVSIKHTAWSEVVNFHNVVGLHPPTANVKKVLTVEQQAGALNLLTTHDSPGHIGLFVPVLDAPPMLCLPEATQYHGHTRQEIGSGHPLRQQPIRRYWEDGTHISSQVNRPLNSPRWEVWAKGNGNDQCHPGDVAERHLSSSPSHRVSDHAVGWYDTLSISGEIDDIEYSDSEYSNRETLLPSPPLSPTATTSRIPHGYI
jgi:hypothetical protein